jgi:hypothetical protein
VPVFAPEQEVTGLIEVGLEQRSLPGAANKFAAKITVVASSSTRLVGRSMVLKGFGLAR